MSEATCGASRPGSRFAHPGYGPQSIPEQTAEQAARPLLLLGRRRWRLLLVLRLLLGLGSVAGQYARCVRLLRSRVLVLPWKRLARAGRPVGAAASAVHFLHALKRVRACLSKF